MIAKKYAILSTWGDSSQNDIGNGYVREFIKNGATFIDYEDAYLRFGNKSVQEYISNVIDENDIEVLVYQSAPSDFHFSVEFFQLLQEKVFTVMMLGDTAHFFDNRDIYYAQSMDLVIVYDCLEKYRFRQYGIESMSFYSSYDTNKYFRRDDVKKSIDVSFVGRLVNKMGRKEYIDYLIQNGISIEVFGTGSNDGPVNLEKMVEIFNKTRINLSFSGISLRSALEKEPNIKTRMKQVKGRVAEIALCGGLVLSEYVPGIEEVFEIDREIVVFHTKEEMLERTRYYLEHENEREKIANNGYVRALRDYDVSTAIPRLINRVEEFRKDKTYRSSKVCLDSHFIKYYATFRIAMIVELIKLKKWHLVYEELRIILRHRRLDLYRMLKFLLNMFPRLKELLKSLRD